MKKYLLLIEDEKIWEEFKKIIDKDINSEILDLIKDKIKENKGGKKRNDVKKGTNDYFCYYGYSASCRYCSLFCC